MKFETEYIESIEEMLKIIKQSEGRCTQQVVFSTFHNCITQIDWTNKIIRSNIGIIKKEKKE